MVPCTSKRHCLLERWIGELAITHNLGNDGTGLVEVSDLPIGFHFSDPTLLRCGPRLLQRLRGFLHR
jgi:hypothetical protein